MFTELGWRQSEGTVIGVDPDGWHHLADDRAARGLGGAHALEGRLIVGTRLVRAFERRIQRHVGHGHVGQFLDEVELLTDRQPDHACQLQLRFLEVILRRRHPLPCCAELNLGANDVDPRHQAVLLHVRGLLGHGFGRLHLRARRFGARAAGEPLQVQVGAHEDHQIACVLDVQLSGGDVVILCAQVVHRVDVHYRLRHRHAPVEQIERPDHGREAELLGIEPEGRQVEDLSGFRETRPRRRQKVTERRPPRAPRVGDRFLSVQDTEVVLQRAVDGIENRQR